MITIDMTGQTVLITGGTKGIGLAAAFRFAKAGAKTFLTYKWGSTDLEQLAKEFKDKDCIVPTFIQADVSVEEDTQKVMETIAQEVDKIDIFISNVGFASKTLTLDDYKKRSLYKTLDYSSWPLVEYSRYINKTFNSYPRNIIAVSSDGPDHYYPGYDFVAASKAMLEFLTRYLAVHLQDSSCVNAVRFGTVKTESFELIFGDEFFNYLEEHGVKKEQQLTVEECGDALFGLCSGYFNAMTGQIIQIDYGLPFKDNSMNHYQNLQNKKNA